LCSARLNSPRCYAASSIHVFPATCKLYRPVASAADSCQCCCTSAATASTEVHMSAVPLTPSTYWTVQACNESTKYQVVTHTACCQAQSYLAQSTHTQVKCKTVKEARTKRAMLILLSMHHCCQLTGLSCAADDDAAIDPPAKPTLYPLACTAVPAALLLPARAAATAAAAVFPAPKCAA
jgi:hypothetical protein